MEALAIIQIRGDKNWALLSEQTFTAIGVPFLENGFTVTAPIGFITDLASIPKFLYGWFPGAGAKWDRPAVLHDLLRRLHTVGKARNGSVWLQGHYGPLEFPLGWLVDPAVNDRWFRQELEDSGVSFVVRWIFWVAVRANSILIGLPGNMFAREKAIIGGFGLFMTGITAGGLWAVLAVAEAFLT